jgi:hypothetical protein
MNNQFARFILGGNANDKHHPSCAMGKLRLPRYIHRKDTSNPSWPVVTYPYNQSWRQDNRGKIALHLVMMRWIGGAAESGVVVARVKGLVSTAVDTLNKLKPPTLSSSQSVIVGVCILDGIG